MARCQVISRPGISCALPGSRGAARVSQTADEGEPCPPRRFREGLCLYGLGDDRWLAVLFPRGLGFGASRDGVGCFTSRGCFGRRTLRDRGQGREVRCGARGLGLPCRAGLPGAAGSREAALLAGLAGHDLLTLLGRAARLGVSGCLRWRARVRRLTRAAGWVWPRAGFS